MEKPLISKHSKLNLENDIWLDQSDYQEDYKTVIRQRETVRIPFLHQSPQIAYRKYIVQYLKNYTAEKQISHSCLHLTVYIMDIFMDNHAILPERLHLVANVCLLIAAKFEELNVNIPKFEELNIAVGNRYTLNDYKVVEVIILKFFHWYLVFPTAAHYTHYFMQAILSSQDLKGETRTYRTLIFDLHEFIGIFLDRAIDDIHFMQQYTPSRLASAIISAARQQAGLRSWTEQLENLTGYSKEQILEPIQALHQANYVSCSSCMKSVI